MKNIALVFLIIIYYSSGFAQEVISASGDFYQNSSISVSYTIGEPITETFVNGENTLNQGFQQSKLIVTAIETPEVAIFNLHVFPNPTHSIITIENTNKAQQALQYALYDLNGKVLYEICSNQSVLEIDVQNIYPGTYLLKITKNKKQMATYKIVKE
jgi:hypothetical protein